MTEPLTAVLRSLQLAGLDVDAEAALDGVWLALHMAGTTSPATTSGELADPVSSTAERPASAGPGAAATPDVPGVTKTARPWSPTGQRASPLSGPSATASARALTLSRASALPESRELIKALRPLRRRVVSPGAGVLDVETTVRHAAEEDIWIPSYQSTRERWLDVLLVADRGLSMIIWQETIDEVERVLRNSGAFRTVRSWWLQSDADSPAITAKGRGASPPTPEKLVRLVRGTMRSVILLVSDCVGARWHDGTVPRLVAGWSRHVPVALLQVTPEWFWPRTALHATVGSQFRSPVPVARNREFRWDPGGLGAVAVSSDVDKTLLRVPAATLTSRAVARVASLIAGVGREWAPGVVFDLTWNDDEGPPIARSSADARVARFRALASREAQRLAAAYAASPVQTLGVLRLLRRDLLPDADLFTEAEVLLGGIVTVKRDKARWDAGASLPLEFFPDVRPLLLDGAIAGDVVRVLAHAAGVAAAGVGPTFTSWLADPAAGLAQLDPTESAFAASAAEALRRLGGAYARMVKPGVVAPDGGATAVSDAPPTAEPREQDAVETGVGQSESPSGPTTEGRRPPFVGRPHELLLPVTLHGREDHVRRIDRGLTAQGGPAVMALVGPAGMGKSALAAQAAWRWRARRPDEEPFVWSFYRDPATDRAWQALTDHYLRDRSRRTDPELFEELARRGGSLMIFDGTDAVRAPAELASFMRRVEQIAAVPGVRVVLTAREHPARDARVEVLEVGPLDASGAAALVGELVATLDARDPAANLARDRALLTRVAREIAGGNPLVVTFLAGKAATLSVEGLLEELDQDVRELRAISADQLPRLNEQLDLAVRARELSARGRSLLDGGSAREASSALQDVVGMRSRLPSLRLRARALFDLSLAHVATGRRDEAVAVLGEAGNLARESADAPLLARVFDATANVQEVLGNHAEARIALERLRELRPDQGPAIDERLRRLAATASPSVSQANDPGRVPPDDAQFATMEFLIRGGVQGVGFRAFVERHVRELGLRGSAENLRDGRIRVQAAGPRARLHELEARLRQGPPRAKVDDVATRVLEGHEVADRGAASTRPRLARYQRSVIAIGIGRTGKLPALTAAVDASRSFSEWATGSQQLPPDRVSLITDDDGDVTTARIADAVRSRLGTSGLDQLVIYFAGYAITANRAERWLLSRAPDDVGAAIDVGASAELARSSGIPHVVFVSDTCRVSAESIPAHTMLGHNVFPDRARTDRHGWVDQFSASSVGVAARDPKDVAGWARRYGAVYTKVLLSALAGAEPSIQDERDGVRYIRPRLLAKYLSEAVPASLRSQNLPLDTQQVPDARIESGDDAWLAVFD